MLSHAREVYATEPPFPQKLSRTMFILSRVMVVADNAEQARDLRREAMNLYHSLNGGAGGPDSIVTLEEFDAAVIYSSR